MRVLRKKEGKKMETSKILLLAQLVDALNESMIEFKQAHAKNDKKKFNQARAAILDFQHKINFLLNKI